MELEEEKKEKNNIKEKVRNLPRNTGVYLFKDADSNVIYVGKARNLRKRVAQYFSSSSSDSRFFIDYIRRNAHDIEAIATDNEAEALILENNLIKQYRPKFNIRLRDDKDYLCIRVDTKALWPKLEPVRRPTMDGAKYFGPYHSGTDARELLDFLNRSFKLRTCSDTVLKTRKRPCLQYQIGRCTAPCTLYIDREEYMSAVDKAVMFLEGKTKELKEKLYDEMMTKSNEMKYEEAGKIRDLLRTIENLEAKQRVVDFGREDTDVVAIARKDEKMVITQVFVRSGKVIGIKHEKFNGIGSTDEDSLTSFLIQYYGGNGYLPSQILVQRKFFNFDTIEEIIFKNRSVKVKLESPRRGKGLGLIKLAEENANKAIEEWEKEENAENKKLEQLALKLNLPCPPQKIECIDISHTGGSMVVGAIAVMESGKLCKSLYRKFKVKSEAGGDDFKAMKEVLSRRFQRASAGEKGWELPDLMVIDGGRAHLGLAVLLRDESGIKNMPIIAIAKDRGLEQKRLIRKKVREKILEEDGKLQVKEDSANEKKSNEGLVIHESATSTVVLHDPPSPPAGTTTPPISSVQCDAIYLEGQKEAIPAYPSSPLGLIVRLRNEAHRFAITYHKKLRQKEALNSVLLNIEGIGDVTLRKLYENFDDLEKIAKAKTTVIAEKTGIPLKVAKRVKSEVRKIIKSIKETF